MAMSNRILTTLIVSGTVISSTLLDADLVDTPEGAANIIINDDIYFVIANGGQYALAIGNQTDSPQLIEMHKGGSVTQFVRSPSSAVSPGDNTLAKYGSFLGEYRHHEPSKT